MGMEKNMQDLYRTPLIKFKRISGKIFASRLTTAKKAHKLNVEGGSEHFPHFPHFLLLLLMLFNKGILIIFHNSTIRFCFVRKSRGNE